MIEEIHGMHRVQMPRLTNTATQDATVLDHNGFVRLALSECSYPVDLTPEQARFLAKLLVNSANRVKPKAATHKGEP